MIYQHWVGTVTYDRVGEEAAARPLEMWLPAEARVRASRFEREPWRAVPLVPLAAPGGSFAGTVEYWYGDEEEDDLA